MAFDFRSQLGVGQMGEAMFFEAHAGRFVRTDGRKGDFVCSLSGDTYELKTDTWDMNKTPNMFIEHLSDEAKGTPGGPWRALQDGSKFFVYMFAPNLTYFTFETAALVARMETLLPSLKPFPVQNKGYVTVGYRVPRASLADIYSEVRLTVSVL
jgi:hypothetical protein